MAGQDRIQLKTIGTAPRLLSPLEGFAEVTSRTEYRIDPLTGRVAIVGLNLAGKRTILYGETDEALLTALAAQTATGCFFCPDRVEQVTPRFPPELLPGDGRLRSGECLLFPNLFPLTDVHAVIALGHRHFRWLDEFTPALLAEGLGLAVDFIREVTSRTAEPRHWVICCNYLPPGGASIVHPHVQILGSALPLTAPALELERARAYFATQGTCYFEDLVALERDRGERLVATYGPVTWLAAFAPRGNTEVQGHCEGVAHLSELTTAHVQGLAAGLSQALRAYHAARYSAFNFCLYAAPEGGDGDSFRVYASLVSRQSLTANYRCDDYFLQKMLGTEILVDSPEQVAQLVRAAANDQPRD